MLLATASSLALMQRRNARQRCLRSRSALGVVPSLQRQAESQPTASNVSLRLPLKLTAMVDHWRERQADQPNRNEAIRRLLEFALALDPQLDEKDQSE
jgi:hypothetical protein